MKQRRYFVKQGLFVDHDDDIADGQAVESADEIIDKRAVDVKTSSPKKSR